VVVEGIARWAVGGCSPYLNSNQEHTVVWLQLKRVDPTSSVQDHTTVLQKVTMLYFINNFYLCYRNYKNICFHYTLSSWYIQPNNL